METLITPKSKQESNLLFGNDEEGCPSLPKIADVNEFSALPMFVHPAEKPQNNEPVYRAKMYELF
jgi:hypothetical protein